MPRSKLLLSVDARDCDAEGYYDVRVDMTRMVGKVGDSRWMEPVRRAVGGTVEEILRSHMPGAHLDTSAGTVTLNAGHDEAAPAGRLEIEMWDLLKDDVARSLSKATGRQIVAG